jgi:hypothetical protein
MTETRASYTATPADVRDYGPRVLAILKAHVGRANAINARDIAQQIGWGGKYDDRRVRMIIRELIIGQRETIGASDHEPRGYWWIATEQEARDYLANLKSRNLGIWKRYKSFSYAAFARFKIPIEQLRLDLDL